MWNTAGLLGKLSHHDSLNIIISEARKDGSFPYDLDTKIRYPHRIDAYLLIFMRAGWSNHRIDLEDIILKAGNVLLVTPHQVHSAPSGWLNAEKCYKLAFDDHCLSQLPQSFDFLLNPANNPVIHLAEGQQARIERCIETLIQVLAIKGRGLHNLLLAHLSALLAELNYGYFRCNHTSAGATYSLSIFAEFKRLINEHLRQQPTMSFISTKLSISENRLLRIVKKMSGYSPKEYMLRRTVLEAQRMLLYECDSVKEITYELGFADPDYFSRLFKKYTGKTVSIFLKEMEKLQSE